MKLKQDLTIHDMGDEFVVISSNPESFSGMMKLNKTGAFIFEKLQENLSKEEIVKKLQEKYEVEEKTAASDLEDILKIFEQSGLMCNE